MEWLGDVGGLFGGLQSIGNMLVGPVSLFAMKAELFSRLFSNHQAVTDLKSGNIRKQKERFMAFIHVDADRKKFVPKSCAPWRRKVRRLLNQAEQTTMRQLDLVRYTKLRRT